MLNSSHASSAPAAYTPGFSRHPFQSAFLEWMQKPTPVLLEELKLAKDKLAILGFVDPQSGQSLLSAAILAQDRARVLGLIRLGASLPYNLELQSDDMLIVRLVLTVMAIQSQNIPMLEEALAAFARDEIPRDTFLACAANQLDIVRSRGSDKASMRQALRIFELVECQRPTLAAQAQEPSTRHSYQRGG